MRLLFLYRSMCSGEMRRPVNGPISVPALIQVLEKIPKPSPGKQEHRDAAVTAGASCWPAAQRQAGGGPTHTDLTQGTRLHTLWETDGIHVGWCFSSLSACQSALHHKSAFTHSHTWTADRTSRGSNPLMGRRAAEPQPLCFKSEHVTFLQVWSLFCFPSFLFLTDTEDKTAL